MPTCYRIFITKSLPAAQLIYAGMEAEKESKKYTRLTIGPVANHNEIPALYYGSGFFCVIAEFQSNHPTYELHIC